MFNISDSLPTRYNSAMNVVVPPDMQTVLPRLLAGGPENLRLSRGAALTLAAVSVTASIVQQTVGDSSLGLSPPGLVAACAAMITAGLAARWLGTPIGLAAGVAELAALHIFRLPLGGRIDGLLCLLAALAMGAFALANVCGGRPTSTLRSLPGAFYAAVGLTLLYFGWREAAALLIACCAYLVLNQDGRAFHFLIRPLGLGIFAACAGLAILLPGYLTNPHPQALPGWHSLKTVALETLPWAPLCAVAIAMGCWRGHYATAFWQFVVCWSAVPLLSAVLGSMGGPPALAIASPPLSILAAAGLWEIVAWHRKRNRRSATADC